MRSSHDIVLNEDFVWDLDGLIDVNLLDYGSPYVLGLLVDVVKETEKYSRASFLGESLEYTTSSEIYSKFGLLSFSFEESYNVIKYSLSGSFKIMESLTSYEPLKYSIFYDGKAEDSIVENIIVVPLDKRVNFPEFVKYLRLGKCIIPDMNYIFNNSFNYEVDLNSSYLLQYFFNFLESYEIYLEKPVDVVFDSSLLKIKGINSVESLRDFLSNLNLLSNYCAEIHLHIKFVDLLYGLKDKDESFIKYLYNNLSLGNEDNKIKFICKDLNKKGLDINNWLNLECCPFLSNLDDFKRCKEIISLYFLKHFN